MNAAGRYVALIFIFSRLRIAQTSEVNRPPGALYVYSKKWLDMIARANYFFYSSSISVSAKKFKYLL